MRPTQQGEGRRRRAPLSWANPKWSSKWRGVAKSWGESFIDWGKQCRAAELRVSAVSSGGVGRDNRGHSGLSRSDKEPLLPSKRATWFLAYRHSMLAWLGQDLWPGALRPAKGPPPVARFWRRCGKASVHSEGSVCLSREPSAIREVRSRNDRESCSNCCQIQRGSVRRARGQVVDHQFRDGSSKAVDAWLRPSVRGRPTLADFEKAW